MVIKLNNISKFYKSETNVFVGIQNVTAEFQSGEIVAVVGESGSGKSTFLNVVSLMDSFESGELTYDDCDVSGLSSDELERERRKNVSFIFQNYNIIDSYSVLKNVMLPLIIRGYSSKLAKEKAKSIIKKVGLEDRMHHRGTKLSGGEKQRCVIARALASDSKVLACDEPTGNLDSKTGAEIMALIKEISKDRLVFIVTHNYDEIKDYATRKLKFFDGKLVEDISLKEKNTSSELVLEDPEKNNKTLNKIKIGLDNIISTPKKSIFSFIITCCISFIIIMLISSTTGNDVETTYNYNNWYKNLDPNRIIAYDTSGDYLDINSINNAINNGSIIENAVYEELQQGFNVLTGYNLSDYLGVYYKSTIMDEVILNGRMPENENEVILGLPYIGQNDVYYDKTIESVYGISGESVTFKVVGIYKSNNQSYITSTPSGNERIKRIIDYSILNNFYTNNEYATIQRGNSPVIISNTDIFKNKKYRDYTINCDIGTIDISDYDFEYIIDPTVEKTKVYITEDVIKKALNKDIKAVSIYSDSLSSDNVIKKLNDIDLVGIKVSKYSSGMNANMEVINKIGSIFMWIGVFIIIFLVYLMSYLILSRVYKTKIKDYVIIRTLGLSKKFSASVVKIENITLTFTSSIFALIIAKILQLSLPSSFNFIKYFTSWYIVIYLIIMLLFSYLLGAKFNKKIFEFSVQETLRGGVSND